MAVSSVLEYIRNLEAHSEEPLNQIKLLEAEMGKVITQIKGDYPHLFK